MVNLVYRDPTVTFSARRKILGGGKLDSQCKSKAKAHFDATSTMRTTKSSSSTVFSTLKTLLTPGKSGKKSKYCETCHITAAATNGTSLPNTRSTKPTTNGGRRRAQVSCEICQSMICMQCRKRCERCKRGVCRNCCDTSFLSAAHCSICDPEAVRLSKADQYRNDSEGDDSDAENVSSNLGGKKTGKGKSSKGLLRSISSVFSAPFDAISGRSTAASTTTSTTTISDSDLVGTDLAVWEFTVGGVSAPASTRPVARIEGEDDDRFHKDDLYDPRFQEFSRAFKPMVVNRDRGSKSTEKERLAQLRTMWFLLSDQERERYSDQGLFSLKNKTEAMEEQNRIVTRGIAKRIEAKRQQRKKVITTSGVITTNSGLQPHDRAITITPAGAIVPPPIAKKASESTINPTIAAPTETDAALTPTGSKKRSREHDDEDEEDNPYNHISRSDKVIVAAQDAKKKEASLTKKTSSSSTLLTPYLRMCKATYPQLKFRYGDLHLLDIAKMLLRSWDQLSGREKKQYFVPSNEELQEFGHELVDEVVLVNVGDWSAAASAALDGTASFAGQSKEQGLNPIIAAVHSASGTESSKLLLSPTGRTPRSAKKNGGTPGGTPASMRGAGVAATLNMSELSPKKRRKVSFKKDGEEDDDE